jgi:hypothetical protein
MDSLIYTEVERLKSLRIQELRTRYREVFGADSRTAHKQHLVRQIAWRLQVQAQGGLSERARRRARASTATRRTSRRRRRRQSWSRQRYCR